MKHKIILFFTFFAASSIVASINQTSGTSPIFVNQPLPFTISLTLESYMIPGGVQSGAVGSYQGKYLMIAGRTNGLHNFDNSNDNFPPRQQNTTVFVVDPQSRTVTYRSLTEPLSGLTQQQIDSLSVTSPQFYQSGNTLYITGGYGVDTGSGNFSTKPILTAINVPGLISWVNRKSAEQYASKYIRQLTHPIFQVTGGAMYLGANNLTLLIFGQNFAGYYTSSSNGEYTQQVRGFEILDNGKNLNIKIKNLTQPNPNYRRRDLNVVPAAFIVNKKKVANFIALSGVFTLAGGAWTVPVEITANGMPSMADPGLDTTFKQGMNNYQSAHIPLLGRDGSMYMILLGGITYQYFQNGQLISDINLPFTNQITTVKRDIQGNYQQYLLPVQYPFLVSTASNPGNTLLFGAGSKFMPSSSVPLTTNNVLDLSQITKPTVIGYILGGIQSTLPNTVNPATDSAASPYIFKVTLAPAN